MDVTEMTAQLRDFLAADGPCRVQEPEFLNRMRELETHARVVQAALLEMAAEAEARCLPVQFGCTSLTAFLQDGMRISRRQAGERASIARALPTVPATREALREGHIDPRHVQIIAKTLKALPSDVPHAVRDEVEAKLAGYSKTLDTTALDKAAQRLLAYLNPDGVLREEKDTVASRELIFGTDPQGRTTFKGRLDLEAGAAFRTPAR